MVIGCRHVAVMIKVLLCSICMCTTSSVSCAAGVSTCWFFCCRSSGAGVSLPEDDFDIRLRKLLPALPLALNLRLKGLTLPHLQVTSTDVH